jgi:hypothetical protein
MKMDFTKGFARAAASLSLFLNVLVPAHAGVTQFSEQQSYSVVVAEQAIPDGSGGKLFAPKDSVFKVTKVNAAATPSTIDITFTKVSTGALAAGEKKVSEKISYTVSQADIKDNVVESGSNPLAAGFSWTDLGFGPGLAVAYHRSKDSRVTTAQLDGAGNVRATNEQAVSGSVLLEVHCFNCHIFGSDWSMSNRSVSPFLAIQVTGNNSQVLNGIGYGVLFGFKNQGADQKLQKTAAGEPVASGTGTSYSMNIGIGVLHEFGVQQLSTGTHVDQPLPSGQTQITYKTATRTSPMLLFSFAWE